MVGHKGCKAWKKEILGKQEALLQGLIVILRTLCCSKDVCTVEPLYCGHLGDLVECPVYNGTPLLWTPWGPGEVSCIQWNPSIVDTLGTW